MLPMENFIYGVISPILLCEFLIYVLKHWLVPEILLPFFSIFFETLALFGSKPALFDRQRVIDICQTSWVASPKEFFESHTFHPEYNLEKGVKETINWCKKNNWL